MKLLAQRLTTKKKIKKYKLLVIALEKKLMVWFAQTIMLLAPIGVRRGSKEAARMCTLLLRKENSKI